MAFIVEVVCILCTGTGTLVGWGSSTTWDGVILLQNRQFALVVGISLVMSGASAAFAVITEVSWWVECRGERHVGLSEGGNDSAILVDDNTTVTAVYTGVS